MLKLSQFWLTSSIILERLDFFKPTKAIKDKEFANEAFEESVDAILSDDEESIKEEK